MEKIPKTTDGFLQAYMGAAVSCDPLDMRSGRFFIIAYPIFSESKLNILPAQIAVKYHPYALASLLQQLPDGYALFSSGTLSIRYSIVTPNNEAISMSFVPGISVSSLSQL